MWIYYLSLSLLINTISVPYDNGANKIGSNKAPKYLISDINFLKINKKIEIDTENHITNILQNAYEECLFTLNENKFPLLLGGDHTVAISSIFASNLFCNKMNKKLGILWCDAHADFNTIETSPTKNLHGMPVAILCGHTLKSLEYGKPLNTEQFAYFGLRDIDSLEFDRLQTYDMKILEDFEIDDWINSYDYIHVSFDLDCLDPTITKAVNTPVNNGKNIKQITNIFNKIKNSKKLISMDVVEYNPEKGNSNDIIIKILKSLLN